jgi:hypothetical protein
MAHWRGRKCRLRMLLYPQVSPLRQRTLLGDGAVLLCVILLAWLGIKVHDQIAGFDRIGVSVAQAGNSVQNSFRSAANAVGGLPIVGGDLASSLRHAGADTGGTASATATSADSSIASAAKWIGWLVFGLPTALLLWLHVPRRAGQIRRLNAAAQVLRGSADPALRRLLAERAAFSLPYQQLLRHSREPLADLERGHLDPLIAAVLEDAGLRSPPRP